MCAQLFGRASHDPNTLSLSLLGPPRHGCWASFGQLFQSSSDVIVSGVSGKDASCQLLQSTSCHEYPLGLQFPGRRLSPLSPPRCICCPSMREHRSEHQIVTATSDSRERHLRPWMATHLTARPPAEATFPASDFSKGSQSSWVRLASTLSA
jgi:hypothetical protein